MWPYRWVAGEGEPLRSARRKLLQQFWTVYIPFLLLLALVVGLSKELPSEPLQALLQLPVFWLAIVALGFGAPAVALASHLRRIWPYAKQRRGPGTIRVRAYTALVVVCACSLVAGLLLLASLAWRSA